MIINKFQLRKKPKASGAAIYKSDSFYVVSKVSFQTSLKMMLPSNPYTSPTHLKMERIYPPFRLVPISLSHVIPSDFPS